MFCSECFLFYLLLWTHPSDSLILACLLKGEVALVSLALDLDVLKFFDEGEHEPGNGKSDPIEIIEEDETAMEKAICDFQ